MDLKAKHAYRKQVEKLATAEIIELIRTEHRKRMFFVKQRIRCSNALGAYIRVTLGWTPDIPSDEQKRIKDRAKEILKTDGEGTDFELLILTDRAAQAHYEKAENEILYRLEVLARNLPVWSLWGKHVVGFGEAGLATIVGEAGDLSNYPKKGHLWKRMGVGMVDGIVQGKLPSSASAEQWIEHGYNRERRARLYGYVGVSIMLQKEKSEYYQYYIDRKEFYAEKARQSGLIVAEKNQKIAPKDREKYITAKHIHFQAHRKMECRLLRDLLAAWKRAG